MTKTIQTATNIDEVIALLRTELEEKLTERKFDFYLDAVRGLNYGENRAGRLHQIEGCDFYTSNGDHYGTLVVDFDPDWERVNSANYMDLSQPSFPKMYGINIVKPRTNENPNGDFGRTEGHEEIFLGISSNAEKVDSGLSAAFMPRYKK